MIKVTRRKKFKRIIKTRAQVEALEKLYEEHKYPTDELKADLAESSGLSEKQISGWFCHRRLKDKRLSKGEIYANGRQDRSSGVIQDHGSGFRQDSCGSTKQVDDKKYDHREVESRRLNGPEFSTAEVTYEVGAHFRGKSNRMDDASSRSSSSLRNESFLQNAESYDIATSRYISQNLPTDFKGVKPKNGPSGYLKVKGQVENAAITAVKRQLGRHYRLDGPPLGVEFDPLPPGAFESSGASPVNDPHYSTEPVPACSPDMSNVVYRRSNGYRSNSMTNSHDSDLDGSSFKRTKSAHPEYCYNQKSERKSSEHNSPSGMYEGSARKMTNSHDSDLDGSSFKRTKSAHPEYCYKQKPERKSSEHNEYPEWNSPSGMYEGSARKITNSHDSDLDGSSFKRTKSAHLEYCYNQKPERKSSEHNEYPDWNSPSGMYEGSARKMTNDSRDNYKFMAKHGRAEIRTSTGSSHGLRSPYDGKVNGEQVKPRFPSHSEVNRKVVEKDHFDCRRSEFKGSYHHNIGGRELPKIVEKDNIMGNRTAVDENGLVRVKVPRHKETRVFKRPMNEVPDHREYARRASAIGMPLQSNHLIRTAAEMPPNYSEDEETEDSSSFEG